MDTFQPILMILAGSGLLIAAISLSMWRRGEPLKAFLVYFSVFIMFLLVLSYFVIALTLIAFGLIGLV